MKRYPDAVWKPLGEQGEPTMTAHDLVIVHTMVGYMYSTDIMFRQSGYSGTESHFGIGGKWGSDASRNLDGVVWQWQAGGYSADANLEANRIAFSIETADNAPQAAKDIESWTPKQVDALARLIAWLCSVEAHSECPASWRCHKVGIPLSLVPDSKLGRRGVAYHRQGIDPWRVSGAQQWSTAYGKECPGTRRINQLEDEVLPLARRYSTMARTLSKEDVVAVWASDDSDVIKRDALDKDPATGEYPPAKPDNVLNRPGSMLTETNRVARQNARALDALSTALLKVASRLEDLMTELTDIRTRVEAIEVRTDALDLEAISERIAEAAGAAATAVTTAGGELAEDLGRFRLTRVE